MATSIQYIKSDTQQIKHLQNDRYLIKKQGQKYWTKETRTKEGDSACLHDLIKLFEVMTAIGVVINWVIVDNN